MILMILHIKWNLLSEITIDFVLGFFPEKTRRFLFNLLVQDSSSISVNMYYTSDVVQDSPSISVNMYYDKVFH
jgi:hypothetical protein